MNVNQILDMIMKTVMRRMIHKGINSGLDAGSNLLNKKRKPKTENQDARDLHQDHDSYR